MITQVRKIGNTNLYFRCGHRIRTPFKKQYQIGDEIDCHQCDKGKPKHGSGYPSSHRNRRLSWQSIRNQ